MDAWRLFFHSEIGVCRVFLLSNGAASNASVPPECHRLVEWITVLSQNVMTAAE